MEHGILYPCKIPGYGQRRMRYHCRCPLQLDMLPVGHLYLDGAPIRTWAIVSVFEHVGFAKSFWLRAPQVSPSEASRYAVHTNARLRR